jgi:hypothetical protein
MQVYSVILISACSDVVFSPLLPMNVEDLRSRVRGDVADVTPGALLRNWKKSPSIVQHVETEQASVAASCIQEVK